MKRLKAAAVLAFGLWISPALAQQKQSDRGEEGFRAPELHDGWRKNDQECADRLGKLWPAECREVECRSHRPLLFRDEPCCREVHTERKGVRLLGRDHRTW